MDEWRLALRRLLKRPASTLASIATLACAIGAAAVTWSALSAVLLKPLPVRDPGSLFIIGSIPATGRSAGVFREGLVYPEYARIRTSGIFTSSAAYWSPLGLPVRAGTERAHTAQVAFASHEFFDLLGLPIAPGRAFTAQDDRRGAAPVAVLSERYWRRRWLGAEDVVGRTLTVNDQPVTVVGIAPRRFRGINLVNAPDLYLPFHTITAVGPRQINFLAEEAHASSPSAAVIVLGRTSEARDASRLTAQLTALPSLGDGRETRLAAEPINRQTIRTTARTSVVQFSRLLAATVAMLLVIGATTVGIFLLIRTESRRSEFATCLALGASRARLARGVVIEGALLALAAAILSLPVAFWLFGALVGFQLPGGIAIELLELTLDVRAIGAAAGSAGIAVLVIATAAGVLGFRVNVTDALRGQAGVHTLATRRWTRTVLAAAQVAGALVLLSGAALFARSFAAALHLNDPYDPSTLVAGGLGLHSYGYDEARAGVFFEALRTRLASNADVDAMAYSLSLATHSGRLAIDGTPRTFPTPVSFTAIDEHYASTLRLPLTHGRSFTRADARGAPPVAIVSESFARLVGNGGSAMGHRVRLPFSSPPAPPAETEIVGVVPDVITNVTNLEPLAVYVPLAQQRPATNRDIHVRARTDAALARRDMVAAMRELEPAIAMDATRIPTMQDEIARQMTPQRFGAVVLGTLGGIAVLLTLLGAYALAEAMATDRMREMGIRAALGATRRQLGAMILADTTRLIALGIVAGLLLAWLGTNIIRSLLFQVEPFDPAILGSVAGLILVLALAVSLRAALRVARVDLAQVLRNE